MFKLRPKIRLHSVQKMQQTKTAWLSKNNYSGRLSVRSLKQFEKLPQALSNVFVFPRMCYLSVFFLFSFQKKLTFINACLFLLLIQTEQKKLLKLFFHMSLPNSVPPVQGCQTHFTLQAICSPLRPEVKFNYIFNPWENMLLQ